MFNTLLEISVDIPKIPHHNKTAYSDKSDRESLGQSVGIISSFLNANDRNAAIALALFLRSSFSGSPTVSGKPRVCPADESSTQTRAAGANWRSRFFIRH
jgi:hypothetical protein